MSNGGDEPLKTAWGPGNGYETPEANKRSAQANHGDDYDEEGRVGGQNQYFGLSL